MITEAEFLGAEVIAVEDFNACEGEFSELTFKLKDGRIAYITMTLWETLKLIEEK